MTDITIREVCARLATAMGEDVAAERARVGNSTFKALWSGQRIDEDFPGPSAALRQLLAATPWPPAPKPPARLQPPPSAADQPMARLSELTPQPTDLDEVAAWPVEAVAKALVARLGVDGAADVAGVQERTIEKIMRPFLGDVSRNAEEAVREALARLVSAESAQSSA